MLLRPLQRLKKSESVGAQGQEVTFESSLETQLGLQRVGQAGILGRVKSWCLGVGCGRAWGRLVDEQVQ